MNTMLTRLRTRPLPALIAVVSLLLAGAFGVLAYVLSNHTQNGKAVDEVVNTDGGYRIVVPDDWSTSQDGRTTTTKSPDGNTVISFGLGRTGPLPVAATMFFQQVGSKYHDVQVFPPKAQRIGSRNALVYGGAGTNNKNTRIRFLTISVENTPTNFGITVFTEADSDPATELPTVNQIVDSFHTLPPAH